MEVRRGEELAHAVDGVRPAGPAVPGRGYAPAVLGHPRPPFTTTTDLPAAPAPPPGSWRPTCRAPSRARTWRRSCSAPGGTWISRTPWRTRRSIGRRAGFVSCAWSSLPPQDAVRQPLPPPPRTAGPAGELVQRGELDGGRERVGPVPQAQLPPVADGVRNLFPVLAHPLHRLPICLHRLPRWWQSDVHAPMDQATETWPMMLPCHEKNLMVPKDREPLMWTSRDMCRHLIRSSAPLEGRRRRTCAARTWPSLATWT